MALPFRNMAIGGVILALFATAGTALVALTHAATKERIAENVRQATLHSLHQIIKPAMHDNRIEEDVTVVRDRALDPKEPVTIYRARQGGKPVAAILAPVAPDGYGGRIQMLVGILRDGTIAGVRVVSHHETPGLGDAIEAERSDWILSFNGHSLYDPQRSDWKVKKDGGVFDQFTGATITPRAVVAAVHRALDYYDQHREAIFATAQDEDKPQTESGS